MTDKKEDQDPKEHLPRLEIEYCVACRWLLRAGWLAQEILTTFPVELAEVALVPGRTPGRFEIRIDGQTVFSRGQEGRFPEAKEIKQIVRDVVDPQRDLGHSDSTYSDRASRNKI